MFDGHGSVFPAPDHLIFHGLARCCLKTLFETLPKEYKPVVAASLRDALFQCRLRRTRVYNARREKVNSTQIHKWAAVLAVSPVACRRGLPATLGGRALAQSPAGAVLATRDAFSAFTSAAYFYPRVELDGGQACRERYKMGSLEKLGEQFLLSVTKVCLRPECDAVSKILDAPNTHRFRELMVKTVHALGHIRDSLELPMEGLRTTTVARYFFSASARFCVCHAVNALLFCRRIAGALRKMLWSCWRVSFSFFSCRSGCQERWLCTYAMKLAHPTLRACYCIALPIFGRCWVVRQGIHRAALECRLPLLGTSAGGGRLT